MSEYKRLVEELCKLQGKYTKKINWKYIEEGDKNERI